MEVVISSEKEAGWDSVKAIAYVAIFLACVALAISWYQATVMRDSEQRGLRAYLVLTDFGVFCPDCGDTALTPNSTTSIKNSIRMRIENVGQTPARQIIGTTNLYSEPGNGGKLPAKFSFPDQRKNWFISKSDIGKDKYRDALVDLSADEIGAFKEAAAGRQSLFLYGHLDYCDVFQQPHTMAYCFKYVVNGGLNLPVCESYNGEIVPRGRC